MGTEEEHSQLSPLTGAESRHNQDVVMETTATTSVPMVIPGNHAQVQFIHIVPHQEGRHETVMGETLLEESSPIEAPILTALDTSMLTDTSILTDTSAIQLSIIDQSSPRSTHTQASEASKEFTFRLQIANDDDVKIKSPTGIHLQDYDKFQLERLMQDAIKRANYSESSDVDLPGVSEEKMIQDFMNRHVTSDLQMKADISVKDLRRIIPILIMQLFNIREERTQKKVKGLWTERPKGWPDNIPYSDPNNQTKDGPGKPKKEILKKMFDFLLVKYREHIGGHWPNGEQPQHSWSADHQPAWSSEQQLPSWSDSATTGSQPMEQSDLDPATSIASSSSPASSLPVTMVTKLEKVEDNEEWVTELLERIQSKVAYVEKDIYMDDKTKGLLSIIRDLLTKMYEIRNDDEIGQFFVTSGHNFEATLDIVRLKQEMPKDHQRRWEEFQDRECKKYGLNYVLSKEEEVCKSVPAEIQILNARNAAEELPKLQNHRDIHEVSDKLTSLALHPQFLDLSTSAISQQGSVLTLTKVTDLQEVGGRLDVQVVHSLPPEGIQAESESGVSPVESAVTDYKSMTLQPEFVIMDPTLDVVEEIVVATETGEKEREVTMETLESNSPQKDREFKRVSSAGDEEGVEMDKILTGIQNQNASMPSSRPTLTNTVNGFKTTMASGHNAFTVVSSEEVISKSVEKSNPDSETIIPNIPISRPLPPKHSFGASPTYNQVLSMMAREHSKNKVMNDHQRTPPEYTIHLVSSEETAWGSNQGALNLSQSTKTTSSYQPVNLPVNCGITVTEGNWGSRQQGSRMLSVSKGRRNKRLNMKLDPDLRKIAQRNGGVLAIRPKPAAPLGTPPEGASRPKPAAPLGTPPEGASRLKPAAPLGAPPDGASRPKPAAPLGAPPEGASRPKPAAPLGAPPEGASSTQKPLLPEKLPDHQTPKIKDTAVKDEDVLDLSPAHIREVCIPMTVEDIANQPEKPPKITARSKRAGGPATKKVRRNSRT